MRARVVPLLLVVAAVAAGALLWRGARAPHGERALRDAPPTAGVGPDVASAPPPSTGESAPARESSRGPTQAGGPAPWPPGARGSAADREAHAAMRLILTERLGEVLREDRSRADRERMADLLLQAREAQAADEQPAVAREIQLAIAAEFERIAGEPLGVVVARLSGPEQGAPRPPRDPRDPP